VPAAGVAADVEAGPAEAADVVGDAGVFLVEQGLEIHR
jgi:hypothetical protein